MPKKFDQDAKDRIVRLVEGRILVEGLSTQAAYEAVASKLGVSWHSACQWGHHLARLSPAHSTRHQRQKPV